MYRLSLYPNTKHLCQIQLEVCNKYLGAATYFKLLRPSEEPPQSHSIDPIDLQEGRDTLGTPSHDLDSRPNKLPSGALNHFWNWQEPPPEDGIYWVYC